FNYKNNKLILIDYEWFFDFPIPKDFVIFRSIIYLANHLQLMIKNRCSKKFPCVEVFKNFFIPKTIWQKINFSVDETKKYYFWEVNFQNYVNKIKQNYNEGIFVNQFNEVKEKLDPSILYHLGLTSSYTNLHTQPLQQQSHIQNLETQLNIIKSSKFFKLWQGYNQVKKFIKSIKFIK
ncbi:MAG: hypothetical protein ACPLRN_03865, partial [Microgenomates group bacterium]